MKKMFCTEVIAFKDRGTKILLASLRMEKHHAHRYTDTCAQIQKIPKHTDTSTQTQTYRHQHIGTKRHKHTHIDT